MDPCRNIPFLGVADPVAASTHLLGALAACAGGASLWRRSTGDGWRRITLMVFAASMVTLYVASTAYHTIGVEPSRSLLRRLDHAAIYILIAGTFTAIAGNLVANPLRTRILVIVWGFAACGVVLKTSFFGATSEAVDVSLYLGMGWFGVVPVASVVRTHTVRACAPVFGAGAFYTLGALAELFRRPVVAEAGSGFNGDLHR